MCHNIGWSLVKGNRRKIYKIAKDKKEENKILEDGKRDSEWQRKSIHYLFSLETFIMILSNDDVRLQRKRK